MAAGPLHVVPLRPVACGSVLWRMGGVLRATVCVKATFSLVEGGAAQLAAPVELVTSDRLGPPVQRGDLAPAHSVVAASELAPYLPSAGVVVQAVAHAPLGLATPAMAARVAIFGGDRPLVDKLLHIYGDRSASAPTPRALTSMPIVYERAFGGIGVEDNPVGVGATVSGPLPNVVDPADARRPAGFGPIAGAWGARRRLVGERPTQDGAVLDVPDAFDWRFFHAAPSDQQIEYIAGDEWIILDGMHPELPRLRSRLPSARGQARLQILGPSGPTSMRTLDLSADTLVVDAERRSCSVVWRGNFPLDSIEGTSKLRVFAGVELPGFPIPWPEAPGAAPMPSIRAERKGGWSNAPSPTQPAAPRASPQPARSAPMPREAPAPAAASIGQTIALPPPPPRAHPPSLPSLVDAEDTNETTGLVVAVPSGSPLPFGRPTDTAAPRAARALALPFQEGAAARPPRAAEPAQTTAVRVDELRSKLDGRAVAPFELAPPRAPAASHRADIPGAPWSNQPAAPPPACDDDVTVGVRVPPPELLSRALAARQAAVAAVDVDASSPRSSDAGASPWARGATFEPLLQGVAKPPPSTRALDVPPPAPSPPVSVAAAPDAASDALPALDTEDKTTEDLEGSATKVPASPPADPARAAVIAKLASNASLADIEASGVDLRDLDFSGRSLDRACLRGANLVGARMAKASLRGADLAGADLSRADLADADLRGVDASGARLVDAHLDRATIAGANLSNVRARGVSLEGATGDRVNLHAADLEQANLRRAELPGVDLRAAKLGGARCESALMPEAQLSDASGEDVAFDGARLVKLHGANAALTAASFRHCELDGSVWERAKLPRASFEGAHLRGANLQRAGCANASFEGADLANADLQRMNGERADFRGANLEGADVRKMQAPDASFAEVTMSRASADQSNFAKSNFSGADLRNASLRSAILTGANFTNARLDAADLRDADLAAAVMRGASQGGAKLTGANLTGVEEGPKTPG